jgi:hypothetical protein
MDKLDNTVPRTVIDLGTVNSWDKDTNTLYKELNNNKLTEEKVTNLGRCYNQYSFKSVINGIKIMVIYQVDSSD